MANFAKRMGVRTELVTVTGVCPSKQALVVPPSGHAISLTQVIAGNLGGASRAITFYDGNTQIAPQFTIGASGALFWEEIAGQQFELSANSGLNACLDAAGMVDVSVFYVLHDISPGITKGVARAATYVASLASPRATRRPNIRGAQQEG